MTLRLDWCSHQAAKAACERWHYSRRMPVGKMVYLGVWESDRFIGAIVFGWGANRHSARFWALDQTEVCELLRVALTVHNATVSRILSIAVRLLRRQSPGLRLIVSYADRDSQGHHGGIYQASNWVYTGTSQPQMVPVINGCKIHKRGVHKRGYAHVHEWRQDSVKHRYALPLDSATRARIERLRKPYPKRLKHSSDAPGYQPEEGGAEPTRTLQEINYHGIG